MKQSKNNYLFKITDNKIEPRIDDPINLSLLDFLKRMARLPLKELAQRVARLFYYLLLNTIKIGYLHTKNKKNKKDTVIILMTGRMGDLVAAEPVARYLKQVSNEIIWLCRPQYTDILKYNPNVSTILKASSDFEGQILKKIFRNMQWINLLRDESLCGVFGVKLQNKNSHGINVKNQFSFGANTDWISILGTGKKLNEKPIVYPAPQFDSKNHLNRIFSNSKQVVFIHFLSDEFSRSWEKQKIIELCDIIQQKTDLNIIELGRTSVLTKNSRVYTLEDSLPLCEQIGLLSKGDFFVGVDSGFSHIANALNIPSVLLLGEYLGFESYTPLPYQENDIILRKNGKTNEISVLSVFEALEIQRKRLVSEKN